ncbi:Uncharacterised protein [Acinetobacter baumannii]|nr:Uncharacterised protein [Acinetobacter baumannii]
MCFHLSSKLGTLGLLHRSEVFNVHGVHDLTTKAFSHDTCVNAFTCSIDCSCCTRRSTTNHQYIKRIFGIECCCVFFSRVGIKFCHNLFKGHTTLTNVFIVLEDHRYSHDFALFHFVLEECTINHGCRGVRVINGNQVKCLYHVRTVMTAKRNKHIKVSFEV